MDQQLSTQRQQNTMRRQFFVFITNAQMVRISKLIVHLHWNSFTWNQFKCSIIFLWLNWIKFMRCIHLFIHIRIDQIEFNIFRKIGTLTVYSKNIVCMIRMMNASMIEKFLFTIVQIYHMNILHVYVVPVCCWKCWIYEHRKHIYVYYASTNFEKLKIPISNCSTRLLI